MTPIITKQQLIAYNRLLNECLHETDDIDEAMVAADLAWELGGASLSHDIENPAGQDIIDKALKLCRKLRGNLQRDLRKILKIENRRDMAIEFAAFVETYRRVLTRILTTAQIAAILQGAREVVKDLPPIPPFPHIVPPPVLEPAEAKRILDTIRPLGAIEREEAIYQYTGPVQRYLRQSLATGERLPPGTSIDISGLSEEDDILWPIIEEAAKELSEKNLLTRPEFDAVTAEVRQRSFTVANVDSYETLGAIRDALTETAQGDIDIQTFRHHVAESVDVRLSDAHFENVFRTNIQGALSDGQMAILSHPFVRSGFPYVTYDPIHDDRVRKNHLALASLGIQGTNIYRIDDPVFQLFRPPWDYNDRCGFSPVTIQYAADHGIKEAQEWIRTGIEPPPTYVAMPDFRPPPGFIRPNIRFSLNSPCSLRSESAFLAHWDPALHPRDDWGRFVDTVHGHISSNPGITTERISNDLAVAPVYVHHAVRHLQGTGKLPNREQRLEQRKKDYKEASQRFREVEKGFNKNVGQMRKTVEKIAIEESGEVPDQTKFAELWDRLYDSIGEISGIENSSLEDLAPATASGQLEELDKVSKIVKDMLANLPGPDIDGGITEKDVTNNKKYLEEIQNKVQDTKFFVREYVEASKQLWSVREGERGHTISSEPPQRPGTSQDRLIKDNIMDEALRLGGDKTMQRVYISDLKKGLPGFTPKEIDDALMDLADKGDVSLYRLDDPREITPERAAGALKLKAGGEKHIVYIGGASLSIDDHDFLTLHFDGYDQTVRKPDKLIELPSEDQNDDYDCLAVDAKVVAKFFGCPEGDESQAFWRKKLGTTKKDSTDPKRIEAYLNEIGLSVKCHENMTLDDLRMAWSEGRPVICMVQEYMVPESTVKGDTDYGHGLVSIGVDKGYVFVFDSSSSNVLHGEDSSEARNRNMIREEEWMERWHDRQYHRLGIVCGRK